MISMTKFSIKALLASALLAIAASGATAAEVGGIKFADNIKVAGKDLQLNGLGFRTKFFVKAYATGLYLTEKATTPEEVFKNENPRRMQLQIMRDVSAGTFGEAFMSGINNNLETKDKQRIISQISKFGEMFALLDGLKKGDVLDLDWIPGQGTTCFLNGKRIGEITPDIAFHNAVLKIWLGNNPADASLKPKLLAGGAAPAKK